MKKILIKLALITAITASIYSNNQAFTIEEAVQEARIDANRLIENIKETGSLQAFGEHIFKMKKFNEKAWQEKPVPEEIDPIDIKDVIDLHNITFALHPVLLSCAKRASVWIKEEKAWEYCLSLLKEYLTLVTIRYKDINSDMSLQITLINRDNKKQGDLISKIKKALNRSKDDVTRAYIDRIFLDYNEKVNMFNDELNKITQLRLKKKKEEEGMRKAISTELFAPVLEKDDEEEDDEDYDGLKPLLPSQPWDYRS